jgi:hypothetical protein
MEYKVGQILYFVGGESARVIPVRIVEEVVRTTIDGKEKTYTVELPDKKRTHVNMSKLKGQSFDSVSNLNKHMLKNAKEAIQTMVKDAIALTKEVFDETVEKDYSKVLESDNSEDTNDIVKNKKSDDIVSVDIGNGVMAKMDIKDLSKVGA